ncbi:MAG: ATP-binding protein [Chitinispirillaceae bacterium]
MKREISIKNQLTFIILVVASLSTLLAFTLGFVYDYIRSRSSLKHSMRFTVQLMAENCKSPLLFNDTLGAHELLSSFESIPIIQNATLYDSEGRCFAGYRNSKDSQTVHKKVRRESAVYFNENGMHLMQPIFQGEQLFGGLTMHVSTKEIQDRLEMTVLVFFMLFILIMVVSYHLANRLQKIISDPILALKNYVEKIKSSSDYSVRIPQTCHNEIGALQKSFDLMVQQLSSIIKSLTDSRQEALYLRSELKNIIDSISSVIIAVDQKGRIQQINLEARKFIGLKEEDILGRPVMDVVEILSCRKDYLENCVKECKPQSFSAVLNQTEIANQKYLNVSIYPSAHCDNLDIVIKIDDVTEKTRMEMMMIQNEKMMSLGGLAAGMAHEINNPLGIISQSVLNITRHFSPELPRNVRVAEETGIDLVRLQGFLDKRKIPYYLEGILSASKRASEIVTNMLQFSRMSNQSKTAVCINNVIDSTIELAYNEYELKKKFDFRQIRIHRRYDESLPQVLCNVTEMQQVFLNLLKNAAHAVHNKNADSGRSQIVIRTMKEEKKNIRIEIEDNGEGIPDSIRERVFEPFFTTKEVGVGTGLGLSVSYFIITKNHAGSIEFESSAGVGTRFIIRVPLDGMDKKDSVTQSETVKTE